MPRRYHKRSVVAAKGQLDCGRVIGTIAILRTAKPEKETGDKNRFFQQRDISRFSKGVVACSGFQPHVLAFRYGQRHEVEVQAAQRQASHGVSA